MKNFETAENLATVYTRAHAGILDNCINKCNCCIGNNSFSYILNLIKDRSL